MKWTEIARAEPAPERRGHRRRRHGPWPVAALAASSLLACGYRFAAPGSTLPEGVVAVHVPVLANATAEPGVEALVTAGLREGLFRAGRLADGGDVRLDGTVREVTSAVFIAPSGRQPTWRLSLVLELELRRGGRSLRSLRLTGHEEFAQGVDPLWTETYRGAAVRRLAARLSQEALERLADGVDV